MTKKKRRKIYKRQAKWDENVVNGTSAWTCPLCNEPVSFGSEKGVAFTVDNTRPPQHIRCNVSDVETISLKAILDEFEEK